MESMARFATSGFEAGKIVAKPDETSESIATMDLSGRVVMAGAVDMHCHIAGPKVNAARKMQPEQTRAHPVASRIRGQKILAQWFWRKCPSIYTTGYRYTGLGYTTCFDAAISPLSARHVHHEFNDIPNVDTGFFVLVGNNHFAMESMANGDSAGLEAFLGWLLKPGRRLCSQAR